MLYTHGDLVTEAELSVCIYACTDQKGHRNNEAYYIVALKLAYTLNNNPICIIDVSLSRVENAL